MDADSGRSATAASAPAAWQVSGGGGDFALPLAAHPGSSWEVAAARRGVVAVRPGAATVGKKAVSRVWMEGQRSPPFAIFSPPPPPPTSHPLGASASGEKRLRNDGAGARGIGD